MIGFKSKILQFLNNGLFLNRLLDNFNHYEFNKNNGKKLNT
jgi:hypothetical protein